MPHVNKQMASFFLTTRCNLACVYCYNREERSKIQQQTLSLEIAKAGVDLFFSTNKSRHIRFYGPGEPTQAFSVMKEIVEYARKQAGSDVVTTELQTNGCFSKTVREWLLDNLNIIWVSFDGTPEIQNANRPFQSGEPSAPVIEANVRWLINNKGDRDIMIGARVTINSANIQHQQDIIDYFIGLGITYIWCDPLFPSVGDIPVCEDEKKMREYTFDMDLYADEYVKAYRYAKEKGVFYGSFLTCNFDGICNQHCRACTPVPHFTTDGYISACDLVTLGENPKHMECFVYGKWNSETKTFDIDESKVQALKQRKTSNMVHCSNCEVREHCGGYCLGEVQNETGMLLGQKPKTCKAIKRIAKEIGFTDKPYPYLHP